MQLGTVAICREGECDDLKPLGSKFVLKIKYLADGARLPISGPFIAKAP